MIDAAGSDVEVEFDGVARVGVARIDDVLVGREPVVEVVVGALYRLHDHLRVAGDGHEVRVAAPPRDDVGVEVVDRATGAVAQEIGRAHV